MLKRSKKVALLAVCVMVFGVVQPAFAWGNRTGSREGDAVAYGAGAGTAAAIGAAALIFFTGGLATPFVVGAAAVAGVAGAAGGAYYGYNVEEKSLAKDTGVLVGAGAFGAGAGVVAGAAAAAAAGGVVAGGGAVAGGAATGGAGATVTIGKIAGGLGTAAIGGTGGVVASQQKSSGGNYTSGTKKYYDDNGRLYREGDNLIPNNSYTMNGYNYTTDKFGRPAVGENVLRLKESEKARLNIKDSLSAIGKGYEQGNDDRGHLIGERFGGSNGLENMTPMNASINRGAYKKLENKWASYLKEGKEVKIITVLPNTTGDSHRADSFTAVYEVNGKKYTEVIPNN